MPKKKFDYQFEDIRRESTPVSAAGFGDMVEEPENPDEGFVDVDLDADDVADAVSAADNDDDARSSGDRDGGSRDKRREALESRKVDQLEVELEQASEAVAGEVTALKKEVAELKAVKQIDAIEEEFATREAELTEQMEQAMEEGDTKAQSRLNSELIALNSEKQAKQAAAEASVSIIEDLDADQQRGDQPANKRAVQFIRDNQEWWSDPDHEDAVTYVRKLDKKLVEMGFNPDSDAYWTRFNHNFDKKYPDLRAEDPDDIDVDLDPGDGRQRGRGKSPVHQPGGAGGKRGSRRRGDNGQSGSKVRLTAQHKSNMIRFGLDPQNPEHCANYAQEVKATQDREAERRAS
jgi:hypothetical protein